MSVLINALERFEYWLWNNHPKIANSLSSGLTSEEINNMAQSLPFSLSEEIKELYQWSNGCSRGLVTLSSYCDEIIGFMPLDKAIETTYDAEHITEHLNIPCFYMFPEYERWIHFAVCDEKETSPILVVTDDSCTRFTYSNITSMVLTTIECYEKGIIIFSEYRTEFNHSLTDESLNIESDELDEYLDAKEEFEKILNKNNSMFNQQAIRQKYNIEIL